MWVKHIKEFRHNTGNRDIGTDCSDVVSLLTMKRPILKQAMIAPTLQQVLLLSLNALTCSQQLMLNDLQSLKKLSFRNVL
jgi:hypothetical protein